MIRPEQLKQIDYLVEEYRKELKEATIAENELQEQKLKELAKEFAHLSSFETNDLYVMKAVVEKAELIKEKVEEAGLGTNKIHKMYPFGFAKNENKLIEELMHAQARTGKRMKARFNPDYFFSYINNTFKCDEIDFATMAGWAIEFDDNLYSYIIESDEE